MTGTGWMSIICTNAAKTRIAFVALELSTKVAWFLSNRGLLEKNKFGP